jgi:hypothetical protein
MLTLYGDYTGVPYLYLLVSELLPYQSAGAMQQGPPIASAAVLFRAEEPRSAINAAYISFVAGRNGTLTQRVPWLQHYVDALHDGTVITDFDEQMTRFPHAVFSLEKVATGTLDESEIAGIATNLRINDARISRMLAQQQRYALILNNIHIGKVGIHLGDKFENIGAGAVVVNRSTLTNALNRTQTEYGADAAQALKELADAVMRTGQPHAIDSLNALNEELDKPQPSKNRLRTWLDAITSALPNVVDVGIAVAKIAALIL